MTMKQVVLVLVLGAITLFAVLHWPRLREVETGRTPEYPDLRPREYAASPDQVMRAANDAISRLPRFQLVGSGSGPAGSQVRTRHRVLGIQEEIVIQVHREATFTRVNVRSRSERLPLDFGQNARNIRALLAELDRVLAPSRRGAGVH